MAVEGRISFFTEARKGRMNHAIGKLADRTAITGCANVDLTGFATAEVVRDFGDFLPAKVGTQIQK